MAGGSVPPQGRSSRGDRPEVAVLDPAAAGVEHRRLRLVDRDLAGAEDQFTQPQVEGLEFGRDVSHPERQDRSFDVEALRGQHLGLPVERQMPGVFGDQHRGHHRLSRKPALDQPLGGRRLNHRLLAGAASVFGTVRHDRPELRRDDVESLGGFLDDHMHGRAAARAGLVLGLDRHMDAWKMGGKRAAIGPALFCAGASAPLVLLVVGRLARGDRLLDILERQGELVRIELLGPTAELHALQLMQEMLQAIDLRQGLIARRTRRVALGERDREPRLQLRDFDRRLIRALAHAPEENRSARHRNMENGELSQLVTASRRSLRARHVARVKTRPVQPVDERGELRGRQTHYNQRSWLLTDVGPIADPD